LASTVDYNELYRIFDDVAFDDRGFAEQEVIRDYTMVVKRGKTVIEQYNKPVEILLNGVWTNLHTLFEVENEEFFLQYPEELMTREHRIRYTHYLNLTRTHMLLEQENTIIIDTKDCSGIRLRGRDYHKHVMEKEEEHAIPFVRNFSWVDGASDISGVIILPRDDYDRVYTVSDLDGDGEADLIFLDSKEETGGVRPYYEKKDGKTYMYLNHFSGGAGTQDSPYIISTDKELNDIRNNLAAWYALDRDIVMSSYNTGEGWVPIPTFSGTLDGRGYQIKGLYMNKSSANYGGLFYTISSGTVRNLRITDATIYSNPANPAISNVYWGVLTGYMSGSGGLIEKCSVSGKLAGQVNVQMGNAGGLIGRIAAGTIQDCFSSVDVSSYGDTVGGFVGAFTGGNIYRCMSIGKVEDMTIAKSNVNQGGFLGSGDNANLQYNFWDIEKSGKLNNPVGADPTRIRGLTTNQLRDVNQFLSFNGPTGGNGYWDFDINWIYGDDLNKGYPEIRVFKKYALGKGTAGDPFMIYTEEDLNQVRQFLWASFKMGDDVKMTKHQTGAGFIPIGLDAATGPKSFTGTFDGNGRYIANLFINASSQQYYGLFRYVSGKAVIKNLELVDFNITAGAYTGTLVGRLDSSTVSNCRAEKYQNAVLDVRGAYGGGLVGYAILSTIEDSYVGRITLKSSGNYTGGILGVSTNTSTVRRCVVRTVMDLFSSTYASGVVGLWESNNGTIENIYVDCVITNTASTSGVVGYFGSHAAVVSIKNIIIAAVVNNTSSTYGVYVSPSTSYTQPVGAEIYFDKETMQTVSASNISAIGVAKATAEMKHPSILTNVSWNSGVLWDFGSKDLNGGYPYLKAQIPLDLPILGFRNEFGKYFADKNGNLLRYLEYGTLIAGQTSPAKPVWLQNNANFSIVLPKVWVDLPTVATGIKAELSMSDNPFTPLAEIEFNGTYKTGEAAKFFVRFSSDVTVKVGGTFDLRAKASPV